MNAEQLAAIRLIFSKAEALNLPLWLENGWAIDARLGRITREHEDIDIAFPADRRTDYVYLIAQMGFGRYQETDYGFLMWKNDVLLDSEPCELIDEQYGFQGYPTESCPMDKEGMLEGEPIRCLSWAALYYEFLVYRDEVPETDWRPKDMESLKIIKERLSSSEQDRLDQLHAANRA